MPPFVAASAVSNALQFAARHWKWFALGALIIAVVIGFKIVEAERDAAQKREAVATAQRNEAVTRLRVSNASLDRLESDVDAQNDAIDGLATEGNARIQEGQAAILAEVRRGAKANTVARELTQSPTTGDQSKTSPKVLANKDML